MSPNKVCVRVRVFTCVYKCIEKYSEMYKEWDGKSKEGFHFCLYAVLIFE